MREQRYVRLPDTVATANGENTNRKEELGEKRRN
jgi:hypothetical protein